MIAHWTKGVLDLVLPGCDFLSPDHSSGIDSSATPCGDIATLFASETPYSTWFMEPALIGPFGPGGPGTYPVSMSATAIARDFDTAIITDSGDAWMDLVASTATFNPLILAPGQSGVIHLYIQPDPARIGKTVSGDVFIDTFSFVQFNGDELARIPYRYRVVQ